MSAVAEGTDRLVAERVLSRPQGKLIATLPLPQPDCMSDFDSSDSREEFLDLLAQADEVVTLPPTRTREDASAAAGYYVLDHCDELLAVWDGEGTQRTGGIAEMFVEARRRGLPLAWVRAGNRRPGTRRPVTLGEEQGQVTLERLPAALS